MERFPPPGHLTLQVVAIDRSAQGQMDLTLQGPDLSGWPVCRPGAWVRVFIPGPEGDVGRVYSIRDFDRSRGLLRIQVMRRMVEAGRSGWLIRHLKPGDRLHVAGPKGGAEPRLDVDWHVMLGDETAAAAICSRLERLPATMPVEIRIEAPWPASAYRGDPRIRWLRRDPAMGPDRSGLWQALRELPPRSGRGELWIAGESVLAKALQQWCGQHWVDCELDIRAIPYWQKPASAEVAD